ncbi:MAG TPA: class I SAM-dependent methyltransferase, partial [Elusimicrobiota bacterium]|nr:class I SAM-dependent methyltransferase [Elusimicrobiota bacterium]
MRKEWWKLFFRPEVFPLTGVIPEADTRAEVRILARLLPRGAKVLDVACGEGRHVLALARRGAGVTGLDFSAPYLAAARRRARAEGLRARFVRGDMRRIPFRGEFDAVLNLWTSFGYFPDPADDLRAARAMLRALKPGGLLVLELIDAAWLRRHFEARRWSRREAGWVLEESR